MATYRVISWKGIPSLVEAQDGGRTARVPLSQRFQDLIDAAAMRQGASESQAYLDGWEAGPVSDRPGSAEAVAQAIAGEFEGTFEAVLKKTLLSPSP
ncbi:MAG: virulence factor [Candidatus Rokubacteria bacterium]|nr:virulence factor [Candidatus Rokubacteria bacterium]